MEAACNSTYHGGQHEHEDCYGEHAIVYLSRRTLVDEDINGTGEQGDI